MPRPYPLRPAPPRGARRRAVLTLGLLLALPSGVARAQTRNWSPEDRTVIGDFTEVDAVAASMDRVYAVTPEAVLTLDPQLRKWYGPYLPPDPSLLSNILAAIADPLDGSLWIVRRSGWVRFQPTMEFWEQGLAPGTVLDVAFDQSALASGLFLRTPGGWYLASRGGVALPTTAPRQPVRPATVNDAVRDNPAIQASSAGLLFASRARNVRYTSAVRAMGFLGRGWYLGTTGAGLVYFPEGAGIPETLTYGLPSGVVDAVSIGADGVWAVTERTTRTDPAVSFVSAGADRFVWYQGPRATGLPFTRARRVLEWGSALWIATDAGVVRLTPKDEDVRQFSSRGLPDPQVLDLAQRRGLLVAATAHGLARYDDSLGFRPLAPDFGAAALGVVLSGDTAWVGTRLGLFAALPDQSDLLQPQALEASPVLQGSVVDLTWRADTLVALLADRIIWRDPGTGRYTPGPGLGGALGRLHTIINGRSGLILAGLNGVGFASLNTPLIRTLLVPGDLPGRVTDLAVDDTYLWVATLRGLVRFRLDALGR